MSVLCGCDIVKYVYVNYIVLLITLWSRPVQSVLLKIEDGWLQGKELDLIGSGKRYYSFKGIPYAKAPLGHLRFRAPLPPKPWSGIKNASVHGSICMQRNNNQDTNEDCLFVNVYSRELAPKLAPVMVFIHGYDGDSKINSGNDDFYGPHLLLPFGVVLVTFNYRLDVLGFLNLGIPEAPGNAGMKDQIAVLKWIQINIRHFGGDPQHVTIFGHGFGGAAVGLHLLSPLSRGLFHRAISMSGVPLCDIYTPFEIKRKAFTLGAELGYITDSPRQLLNYLQSIAAENLINANITSECTFRPKTAHFVPSVEDLDFGSKKSFLTEDPFTTLKNGNVHKVDYMIGMTDNEFLGIIGQRGDQTISRYRKDPLMFVPAKILFVTPPAKSYEIADAIKNNYFGKKHMTFENEKFLKYLNNAQYSYNTYRFYSHLPNDMKVYVYKFSCYSERNIFGKLGVNAFGIRGAAHLDDLMYLFHPKEKNLTMDPNSDEYKLAMRVSLLFTNFAKLGNPTPSFMNMRPEWPEYEAKINKYYVIGNQFAVHKLNDTYIDFWNNVFDKVGLEF